MARLVAQTLAMLVASGLVYVLVRRAGVRLPVPRAAAVAVLAFLAVTTVSTVRDSWQALDGQRKATAAVTASDGRNYCIVDTQLNGKFLAWLAARLPDRAKYVMSIPDALHPSVDTCIRFLLLPRIQVAHLDDAQYVVLWEHAPGPLLNELARRSAVIETYDRGHRLARLP
jgi:hypothetical protein